MKVAIITDQHFGMRKGSQVFHNFISKFYKNVFFPTLEEEGIDTVIDLGDTFDNRKSIDFWSLEWAKKNYYSILQERNVKVHTVVGNHTAFYKNSNKINAIDLLLQDYSNVKCYSEATEDLVGGLPILFIPWINEENRGKTEELIKSTKAKVAMGHLELAGFEAHPGYNHQRGDSSTQYKKFDKVFSGHYHTKSTKGNVTYLGNPYQIYWNDYGDRRGFHIFDTEDLSLRYIKNPYTIFDKINYNDEKNDYSDHCYEDYNEKFIKIIVEKKTDYRIFEKFLENIYYSGAHDVKVIENFDLSVDSEEEIEVEDTLTTLEKYVNELDTNLSKSSLTCILKNLYVEASQV